MSVFNLADQKEWIFGSLEGTKLLYNVILEWSLFLTEQTCTYCYVYMSIKKSLIL